MSQILTIPHSDSLGFGGGKGSKKSHSVRTKTAGFFQAKQDSKRLTLNFLLVVLICTLGVFYIFEVNNVATQGFQFRENEKRLETLREENNKLKLKEAELRSMYNIERKTKDLNMVAPKDVSYMTLPGNVAMK